MKYNRQLLLRIEDLLTETDYALRYEKGSFKSGYCLLKNNKIAVVNKYFTEEGKITALIEILKEITLDVKKLSEKNKKLYFELVKPAEAQLFPTDTNGDFI